jgi:hypothetical protein
MFKIAFALLSFFLAALLIHRVPQAQAAEKPEDLYNRLSPKEVWANTLLLFDGKTTYGWESVGEAKWEIADGEIRTTGDKPGFLVTTSEFADFQLSVDFKAAAGTNSGVFIRSAKEPKDPTKDCYEINIAAPGVSEYITGSIVARQKPNAATLQDPTLKSTDWVNMLITAEGNKIKIECGGTSSVTTFEDTSPNALRRGRIGLQANKGAVAFRNIKLRPRGLQKIKLDKDLTGWKIFQDEVKKPGTKAEYSVTDQGELQVKNGPGSLEYTAAEYGDFVLSFEVMTKAPHLNSGVFFRQIPGEFTLGYECQIQNQVKDGDPAKPFDCGTGGFYRRSDARFVNGKDLHWTRITLMVHGPHMATWVNNVQVSDWTDERKPDDNPRKGLRVKPGTLSIQGPRPNDGYLVQGIPDRRTAQSTITCG